MSIFELAKLYLLARPLPAIVAIGLGIANSILPGSTEVAHPAQLVLSLAVPVSLLFVGYTALVDIYRNLNPEGRRPVEGSSTIWSYAFRSIAIGLCWVVPFFALYTVVSRLGLSPTSILILLQIPLVIMGSLAWSVFGVWAVAAIANPPARQELFQRTKGPVLPIFGMLVVVNGLFSVAYVLSNIAGAHAPWLAVSSAVVFATSSVLREIVFAPILVNAFLRDRSNLVAVRPTA